MKNVDRADDELRPEYDLASMKGGVRGKYAARLRKEGHNLGLLEPEVAAAFPSDAAVNEALRGVLNTTRAARARAGCPTRHYSRRRAVDVARGSESGYVRLAAERQG